MSDGGRACYPGSFHPFTIAHLAIAEAVREQCAVREVSLVLSVETLGKSGVGLSSAEERASELRRFCLSRPWLNVEITKGQLLADVGERYDWLILGADKWEQIRELRWYGGEERHRDEALGRLPRLAIVERGSVEIRDLPASARRVVLADPEMREVSSTGVRSGINRWRAEA